MEKPVATLDKGTICSSWNYCGQRMATGAIDGTLAIFDSPDPASSSFGCTFRSKVHDGAVLKVLWAPPEYGDAVACILADGSVSLWEEVAEEGMSIQWKLCKLFNSKSTRVLDIQFGFSDTNLKLVAAYSDGYIKVYELLDPMELKNWQLQAEFQNVANAVSKFGRVSCSYASISWIPQKVDNQQLSFVVGFNSDRPQLNSAKEHMELEKRYRELTDLLYYKQTQLETMASEKAAAEFQLEKEIKRIQETQAEAERSRVPRRVSSSWEEDTDMKELELLPLHQRHLVGASNQLRKAAKFLDSGAVRATRFLWRYPTARVSLLCYLVFVHLFLMYLLHRLQEQDDNLSAQELAKSMGLSQPNLP